MPNNCLSVLYKHIIQVENVNMVLKVGGTNIPLPLPNKKSGETHAPPPPWPPPPPPPVSYASESPRGRLSGPRRNIAAVSRNFVYDSCYPIVGRKDGNVYLTTQSTHFIYGYNASAIW